MDATVEIITMPGITCKNLEECRDHPSINTEADCTAVISRVDHLEVKRTSNWPMLAPTCLKMKRSSKLLC
jgi:hypothetical protein